MQYSYDDRSVVVVNSYYRAFPGYTVTAKVYNLDAAEKFRSPRPSISPRTAPPACSTLPEIAGLSAVYFVKLDLRDHAGALAGLQLLLALHASRTSPTGRQPIGTPRRSRTYADFTALDQLPPVQLKLPRAPNPKARMKSERITVANPTTHLAFFVHLRVVAAGRDIAPVFGRTTISRCSPAKRGQSRRRFTARIWADPYRFSWTAGTLRQRTKPLSARGASFQLAMPAFRPAYPPVWECRHECRHGRLKGGSTGGRY